MLSQNFKMLLSYLKSSSSEPIYFPLLIVFTIAFVKSLYTLTGFAIFFDMLTSLSILKFATKIICLLTLCLSFLFLMLKLSLVHNSSYFTNKLYRYINGKNVSERNTGNKKLFRLSTVKSLLCCSTVL